MKIEKQQTAIAGFCNDLFFRNAEDVWCFMSPKLELIEWDIDDLNACHEMEKVLTNEQTSAYITTLCLEVQPKPMLHHATAAERREAFLRTLGLWEEEANTTKSASPTSPDTEQEYHETAEQKVAWLKILLCTKSCDPVFTDYWLQLARRNLRLGLPLLTPEPELNLATEESSATDHFRDATKMVSGESSAPTPTQPQ